MLQNPSVANNLPTSREIPIILCGNWSLITAFARARHLCLSWARLIQSTPSDPASVISILMYSSLFRPGLPSCFLPSGIPTKILQALLFSPSRRHSYFCISKTGQLSCYTKKGGRGVIKFWKVTKFLHEPVLPSTPLTTVSSSWIKSGARLYWPVEVTNFLALLWTELKEACWQKHPHVELHNSAHNLRVAVCLVLRIVFTFLTPVITV